MSSFDLIDELIANQDLLSAIALCLHDLQPYANDHWLDHLTALMESTARSSMPVSELLTLRQGLERLAGRHDDIALRKYGNSMNEHEIAVSQGSLWDQLELSAPARSLLDKTLRLWRMRSLNYDQVTNISCMSLQMSPLEVL